MITRNQKGVALAGIDPICLIAHITAVSACFCAPVGPVARFQFFVSGLFLARGPVVILIGAVLPNLDIPPTDRPNRILVRLVRQSGNEAHRDEISPGIEELRVQIARRSLSLGCQLSPNDIIITSGAVEAIN